MLLGPDAGSRPGPEPRARLARWLGGVLLGLLALGVALLVGAAPSVAPTAFEPARPDHGSIEAVGGLLFSKGVVPFELATALLIVAVIGAISVARPRQRKKTTVIPESPTERLFHGPLHPRDAGRPLPKGPVR
jgi:NADH-quinone oxidoreductase subunit J